jgi:hypothetical protein
MRKEIASATEEVRRDIAAKLIEARERTVEMVATRPAYNQDRVDVAIERAAAKLRDEFGDKVAALERGFEARLADLEGRLRVSGEMPIAKVWAPDSAALAGELCTHAGSLWQARQNTGQTPGGDHWLCLARGGEVIEGDAAGALDQRLGDTRREVCAEVAEEQARMLNRVQAMIAAAEGRMLDALASRPAFDPRQTDGSIETAVARVREESDRALEAQKGEFAAQLQALRERLGEVASRPSFDQGQIERAAGAAVEVAVARLRDGLDDVVEAQVRAFESRLAERETQRREFAVELQGFKERLGDIASRPAFDQGQIDRAVEVAVARASAKFSETFDRALETALGAERREFAVQLHAVKDRVAEVASRPSFGQSQIELAAAAAAETAVAKLRVEHADLIEAQVRAFETRLADLEVQRREFAVRLQAVKERISDVAARPSFDQSQVERAAAAAAEIALAKLRVGFDDVVELQARAFDARLVDLEARLKCAAGKLQVASAWTPETVTYVGALVVHDGACWQAAKDTAQVPGGSDWLLIAKAGCDGRSIILRGEYDPRDCYARLDVVTRAGSCWVATRDNPGVLGESDGWTLVAAHGEPGDRGAPGLRGHRGDRGPSGAKIHSWQIDRERYRASPLMEDGTVGAMLELRGLFEQFQIETS